MDTQTIRVISTGGLVEIDLGTATALVTRDQAYDLLGELAAELVTTSAATAGLTVSGLLEAMSEALNRRDEV